MSLHVSILCRDSLDKECRCVLPTVINHAETPHKNVVFEREICTVPSLTKVPIERRICPSKCSYTTAFLLEREYRSTGDSAHENPSCCHIASRPFALSLYHEAMSKNKQEERRQHLRLDSDRVCWSDSSAPRSEKGEDTPAERPHSP